MSDYDDNSSNSSSSSSSSLVLADLNKDKLNDAIGELLSYIDKLSRDAGVYGYVGAVSSKGRRYYRVEVICRPYERVSSLSDKEPEDKIRVWGFIESSTGDVLLPSSRSSPAKHARGNIFDKASWSRFEWTGPQYLL